MSLTAVPMLCYGPPPGERVAVNLAASLFDVARRQPAAPAVSGSLHAWSYRELAQRVSCLAGGLVACGLQSGDRVMLCMENCAEFLELMFACWTAGLCAVPVNARLHPREVEHIAKDCGARLLVATWTGERARSARAIGRDLVVNHCDRVR